MSSASLVFHSPMVASTSGSASSRSQQENRRTSRMERSRSAVASVPLSRGRRPSLLVAKAAAPPSSSPAARREAASASARVEKQKQQQLQQQQQLLSNVVPLSVVAPSRSSPTLDRPPKNRTSSAWVPPQAPILSGGGGGVFFFWQLGAIDYMAQRYDLDRVHLRGASAGGLAVTLAACGVSALDAAEAAHALSLERGIFDRPTGLAGVWGGVVRDWLDALLPQDAAARCAGRLKLVVTEVPSLRLRALDCFQTRAELIDACLASAHVPWFLDGRGAALYRGERYVDGSLYDFLWRNNSELLEAGGDALVLDYCHDDELRFGRLDFLKRLDLDGAKALMASGADYARRQEEAGVLERYLGAVRRKDSVSGKAGGGGGSGGGSSSGIILPSSSVGVIRTPETGLAA